MINRAIKLINLFESLSHFGALNSTQIIDKFKSLLSKFGYPNLDSEVFIDPDYGIFVKICDSDGDCVVTLFYVEHNDKYDAEDIRASIVNDDQDQINVDLTNLDPPTIDIGGQRFVDLTQLSWINKTTISTILHSGNLHVAEKRVRVMFGQRSMRLPVVHRRSKMTEQDQQALNTATNYGWDTKGSTARTFAQKLAQSYTVGAPKPTEIS
jgi:hypothetical protein